MRNAKHVCVCVCVCVWSIIAWLGASQAMQMGRMPKRNTWYKALNFTLKKLHQGAEIIFTPIKRT